MNRQKLTEIFTKDKKLKIVVIIGLAGILLIFLSQFSFFDSKSSENSQTVSDSTSLESYSKELEEKIHALVCSIDGAGEAQVMVTFESDAEYVYANEEKKNTDKTEDKSGEDSQKTQEKEDIEQTLIIVQGSDGEQALLKTTIQPKVKGVVVVCSGGDNAVVQERISDALTTALDIEYNKVCVTKLT